MSAYSSSPPWASLPEASSVVLPAGVDLSITGSGTNASVVFVVTKAASSC